jgi:hypothetical protein
MSRAFLPLLMVVLVGCQDDSGQTGGEVRNRTPSGAAGVVTGGGSNCDESSTELDDLSLTTELGFSAAFVLEFATGTKQAPLEWERPTVFTPSGTLPVAVQPESGTSGITVVITRGSGGARYVTAAVATSGSGGALEGSLGCPDRVEIDVNVELSTDGGALAETFNGTLTAHNPWAVTLSLPFDLEQLGGTLDVSVPGLDDLELTQFSVEAVFGPDGLFMGTIGGVVQVDDGQFVSVGKLELARWGNSPCESSEVPVAVNADAGGPFPSDLLATINDANPVSMTWRDGSHTDLTFEVTTDQNYACLQQPPLDSLLLLPATAHVTTSDGRVDTNLAVDVSGYLDDANRLDRIDLNARGNVVAAAEFQSVFGITGIDTMGQQNVGVLLTSTYDVAGAAAPTGTLDVVGTVPVECDTTPMPGAMSAPGCDPNGTASTLDSATW